MKSFIIATITGFALTLTLWTQLPDRQPAQETSEGAPLQTIAPQNAETPTAGATGGTSVTNGAVAELPAVPTTTTPVAATTTPIVTTPAAPVPQTLTPPANVVYSMADVEARYAVYYASRDQITRTQAALTAELNQYMQMRARLPQVDQMNPAHPVYQAISAIQMKLRQNQALASANSQSAFFEMATLVAAIRVGLPNESLNRCRELLMFVAQDSFAGDWVQGTYTQQTAATQPDLMLNQTPATSVTPPLAAQPTVGVPTMPAPDAFRTAI